MPGLPDDLHVDSSLARGYARQLLRNAIRSIERKDKMLERKLRRVTSLPSRPGKRLKVITSYFVQLFDETLLCVLRSHRKRENINLLFHLGYQGDAQDNGSNIVLEVMILCITPSGNYEFLHSGIRISQHVLERIIQRNRARSLTEILAELKLPILHLTMDHPRLLPDDKNRDEILWLPSPNGLLVCGADGDQPYEGLHLRTLVTFIHCSQFTVQQREQWHNLVKKVNPDLSSEYLQTGLANP